MKVQKAEFVLSAAKAEQFRRDGRPEIAFVGRSNVGKSSLMNKLLARKGLARTSSRPGRTQMVNYFLVNGKFYFVDLPGYGFAKAPRSERERWARLMDQYFRQASGGQVLLIQLVDGKVGATSLDVQAAEYFEDLGHEPMVVGTKIDKVPRSRRVRSLRAINQELNLSDDDGALPLSSVSGEGVQQLWRRIQAFLESDPEES